MDQERDERQLYEYYKQAEDRMNHLFYVISSGDFEKFKEVFENGYNVEEIKTHSLIEFVINGKQDHILTFLLVYYENVDFNLDDEHKLYVDKIKKKLLLSNTL